MARKSQGWRIKQRSPERCCTVVFWHPGERRQVEAGTGTTDPKTAAQRAPAIYAEAIRSGNHVGRRRCVDSGGPLDTKSLSERWLTEAQGWLDPGTIADYAMRFEAHICKVFPSVLDFAQELLKRYTKNRLRAVTASSVRKDLSAVRGLLFWLKEEGILSDVPEVPGIPKRVLGTPFKRPSRASAPELSPDEIRAFLDQLPYWSERKSAVTGERFLVRPRFEFGYETGLRPSTLDKLSVPEHWAPGSKVLRLSAEVLKQRSNAVLPLTWEVRPLDATRGEPVDLLWASPDCTHFSVAKGDILEQLDHGGANVWKLAEMYLRRKAG